MSLELPTNPIRRGELGRLAGFGFMTITGIFLMTSAGPDALEGDDISVGLSPIVILLGFLLLFTLVMARLDWIMRASFWKASLTGGAAFAALVALGVALRGIELGSLPALPLAIVGLVLMLVPPIWQQLFDRSPSDGLIDPRRDEAPQRRVDQTQNALISWGFPLAVVLYVVVVWLLER